MGDTTNLGFGHFLANADIVAKVLLVVLVLMSALSWYLIAYKGISQVIRQPGGADQWVVGDHTFSGVQDGGSLAGKDSCDSSVTRSPSAV